MKKSRLAFIWLLVSISIAAIGSIIGCFFNSSSTNVFVIITLVLAVIKFLLNLCKSEALKFSMDMFSLISLGMTIGTMKWITIWSYIIVVAIATIILGICYFMYTGHKKEEVVKPDESFF